MTGASVSQQNLSAPLLTLAVVHFFAFLNGFMENACPPLFGLFFFTRWGGIER